VAAATTRRRRSGVLLHPTSLAGPPGAGDLGPAAHAFVDRLAEARQSVWQMLPVGPVGWGASPYQSPSTFAGNPALVSPEALAAEGRVAPSGDAPPAPSRQADLGAAERLRAAALRRAFERAAGDPAWRRAIARFAHQQRAWLSEYALFAALKRAHGGRAWTEWDPALRDRQPARLAVARKQLGREIDFEVFTQLIFDRQWQALRAHARSRGVALWGDVPIYVAPDSADAWAHRDVFRVTAHGALEALAGVPPDAFSEDGQLWGNPLYRWDRAATRAWWTERVRHALGRFDRLRLDHFIGFVRYWQVLTGARTARDGRWRRGPGAPLFRHLQRALGARLRVFVEDLGAVVPAVDALRDQLGLAGMRVLGFGLSGDAGAALHLPHSYPARCVAVTGTHDNDTLRGWFDGARAQGKHAEVAFALRYLGGDGHDLAWDAVRAVSMSAAEDVVFPVQDVLGLGSEGRMNRPGVAEGNWSFRLLPGELGAGAVERLGLLTEAMGRGAS